MHQHHTGMKKKRLMLAYNEEKKKQYSAALLVQSWRRFECLTFGVCRMKWSTRNTKSFCFKSPFRVVNFDAECMAEIRFSELLIGQINNFHQIIWMLKCHKKKVPTSQIRQQSQSGELRWINLIFLLVCVFLAKKCFWNVSMKFVNNKKNHSSPTVARKNLKSQQLQR